MPKAIDIQLFSYKSIIQLEVSTLPVMKGFCQFLEFSLILQTTGKWRHTLSQNAPHSTFTYASALTGPSYYYYYYATSYYCVMNMWIINLLQFCDICMLLLEELLVGDIHLLYCIHSG